MNLDDLTLGDIKKLQSIFSGANTIPGNTEVRDLGIQICILQRGWVMVGRCTQRGNYYFLESAYVVRRWGTKKGLGELASSGPLAKTELEPTPSIQFHELTSIALISCDAKKWDDICK